MASSTSIITLSDANQVCSKLQEWSLAKRLSEANKLEPSEASEGGEEYYYLVLDNVRLLSTVKLTIQDQQDTRKSCEYTLGSIYLQIVDPDQRLVTYRAACKKYKVNDPIKATDKTTVVAFFLGSGSSAGETSAVAAAASAEPPPAPVEATAATAAESAAVEQQQQEGVVAATVAESGDAAAASMEKKSDGGGEHRKSSSEDRHHRSKEHRHHKSSSASSDKHREHHRSSKEKSSSSSKHKSSSSSRDKDGKRKDPHRSSKHGKDDNASSPKKKLPKLVTNEELYNNLNVVVGKRTTGDSAGAAAERGEQGDSMDTIMVNITPFDAAADAAMRKSKELVTKALSAIGFDVTPELLQQDATRTLQILQNEIPVGNSASILRAANPRKDLSRVLEIFNETMAATATASSTSATATTGAGASKSGNKPPPPTSRKPTAAGTMAATTSASIGAVSSPSNNSNNKTKTYLIGKKPVIIVPKGMTAPITMMNALDFFEKGIFIPRDVMLKKQRLQKTVNAATTSSGSGGATGGGTGGSMTFTRTVRSGGNTGLVEYEILDNPKKLGSNIKDWERIVAVLVLGQGWQFKDWYHNYNNPVHLFTKTFGYYINMEGDSIPTEIHGWSVKHGKLNHDKRGMDSVTYASFWNGLDEWMMVHKRELLPQAPN